MESGLSNRIMQIALDHSRKVKECGSTLAQLVELWLKGENEEAKKKYELLIEIESEGDKIKNNMIKEIAEADSLGLLGKESEFTSLILETDQLIDFSEGTGQRLVNCRWKNIPSEVSEKALELSEIIMEAMIKVRNAFFTLTNNPDKKVLKLCTDIDKLESKSDKIFRELQRILYSDELKDVSLRKILPFLDAMEHLEDIGDITEMVADGIKILYIAKFGTQ
jgi:predicted phosphate transport protein (TIGR00153 family)